jgi:hypothetical protein
MNELEKLADEILALKDVEIDVMQSFKKGDMTCYAPASTLDLATLQQLAREWREQNVFKERDDHE